MAAVVPTGALTIREAASPAECGEISALFTSIWGGHQHIPPELGRAIVESGGYVVAARRGEVMVGASVGIVGQSKRPPAPPFAHHGSRARRARSGRRPRHQASPTELGASARHGQDRVDLRPARAPQRARSTWRASGAKADALRGRLLRTGARCDQRRGRHRPTRGRVADPAATRVPAHRSRDRSSSLCRHAAGHRRPAGHEPQLARAWRARDARLRRSARLAAWLSGSWT